MNNENNKPSDKNTHQQSLELQNFAIRAPAIPLQRQDGSSHNACVGVEPCWRSMVMVQRILQILSAIELQQPSFQQQRATSRCYKYGGGEASFLITRTVRPYIYQLTLHPQGVREHNIHRHWLLPLRTLANPHCHRRCNSYNWCPPASHFGMDWSQSSSLDICTYVAYMSHNGQYIRIWCSTNKMNLTLLLLCRLGLGSTNGYPVLYFIVDALLR